MLDIHLTPIEYLPSDYGWGSGKRFNETSSSTMKDIIQKNFMIVC